MIPFVVFIFYSLSVYEKLALAPLLPDYDDAAVLGFDWSLVNMKNLFYYEFDEADCFLLLLLLFDWFVFGLFSRIGCVAAGIYA